MRCLGEQWDPGVLAITPMSTGPGVLLMHLLCMQSLTVDASPSVALQQMQRCGGGGPGESAPAWTLQALFSTFADDLKEITLLCAYIDTRMLQHGACMDISLEVRMHLVRVSSLVQSLPRGVRA